MMKILAIITARKGSKELPCKNLRKIRGKSITEISLDCAIEVKNKGYIDDIYVSTDSRYLLNMSNEKLNKNMSLRSKSLSSDMVKSIDVVNDVLSIVNEEFTDVIILQPTSPLRTSEDIINAIKLYKSSHALSLISISKLNDINPNGLYFESKGLAIPLLKTHSLGTPRQKNDLLYLRNGAIFISNIDLIKNENTIISSNPACYIMPKERSINIDTLYDLHNALYNNSYLTTSTIYKVGSDVIKEDNVNRFQYINIVLYFQLFVYYAKKNNLNIKLNLNKINKEIHSCYYFNGENVFFMGNEITNKIKNEDVKYDLICDIYKCIKLDIDELCYGNQNIIVVPNEKWIKIIKENNE